MNATLLRAAASLALVPGLLACAPTRALARRPGEVSFSPSVVRLDNPRAPGTTRPGATLTLDVVAYDEQGARIVPSPDNPLRIEVSGARRGVVTPAEVRLTSGSSVTLAYDGSFVATPLTLAA